MVAGLFIIQYTKFMDILFKKTKARDFLHRQPFVDMLVNRAQVCVGGFFVLNQNLAIIKLAARTLRGDWQRQDLNPTIRTHGARITRQPEKNGAVDEACACADVQTRL